MSANRREWPSARVAEMGWFIFAAICVIRGKARIFRVFGVFRGFSRRRYFFNHGSVSKSTLPPVRMTPTRRPRTSSRPD